MEAIIRQESFRGISLRKVRELDELASEFPTCKVDDHVAAEKGGLAEGMGFVNVQCCMDVRGQKAMRRMQYSYPECR